MLSISPTRLSSRILLYGSKKEFTEVADALRCIGASAASRGLRVSCLAKTLEAAAGGKYRMYAVPDSIEATRFEVEIDSAEVASALPVIRERMFTGVRKGMQSIRALTFTIHAARALDAAAPRAGRQMRGVQGAV